MANTLLSKPTFLNSTTGSIVYQCPTNKRAVIKNIQVANESVNNVYLNVAWVDDNSAGSGSTTNVYPILISGVVPAFGKLRVLDEFLVISAGDMIKVAPASYGGALASGLNSLISVIEQDL